MRLIIFLQTTKLRINDSLVNNFEFNAFQKLIVTSSNSDKRYQSLFSIADGKCPFDIVLISLDEKLQWCYFGGDILSTAHSSPLLPQTEKLQNSRE